MEFFSQLFNPSAIAHLEPAQVHTMMTQSHKTYLLDVRRPVEYKQGHIKGAELIPLDELSTQMARIPKGREISCVCESGSRSSLAARRLSVQGYKVSNMKGGMAHWIRTGLPVKTGLGK
jgi:rhodanese-related sulfurtransferase